MPSRVLLVDRVYGGYEVKTYEEQFYVDAVSGVTLEAYENEVLGIAGESGCGKSTLLKIIYGYVKPPLTVRSGRVLVDTGKGSIDVLSMDLEERRSRIWWRYISYIPQNAMNVLNPTSRIRDHFAEVLRLHQGLDREEAYRVAAEYVTQLGLPRDVVNAFPHQLSGGMRQRVVIALALIMKPRVVLADEPTTALDVVVQRGILQTLIERQRELRNTLILVTHDMGVHAMLTDRIAIMYAGKIVEIGRTEEVFEKPLHPYTRMLIESLPRLGDKRVRKGLAGQPPDLRSPPPGCRFHPRCPYTTDRCRREEPPLVEVEKGHWVACWLYAKK
ncbi:MAG: ABC transporter ATP-binding protein [Thermoprotei archaeon]|nr:MAG: ABC transporter ATP-binding protein [Thermoprotei archaeon]